MEGSRWALMCKPLGHTNKQMILGVLHFKVHLQQFILVSPRVLVVYLFGAVSLMIFWEFFAQRQCQPVDYLVLGCSVHLPGPKELHYASGGGIMTLPEKALMEEPPSFCHHWLFMVQLYNHHLDSPGIIRYHPFCTTNLPKYLQTN